MKPQHIEDLYPLAPMQQGLLFHAQHAPDSAMYFVQWTCRLQGNLQIAALQRAWQTLIDQQPSLRTLFLWDGLEQPLQVVRTQVALRWGYADWLGTPAAEQRDGLEEWLRQDQQRGFDLTQAPLMRVAVIRLAEASYQMIWSFHHVLLDGWSIRSLLQDLFAAYAAYSQGLDFQPQPSRPYRDYIAWLQQRDLAQAETFWRAQLKGFDTPTPLVVDQPLLANDASAVYADREIRLSALTTAALHMFARQHQLTPSTIIEGAWALLLHGYSGHDDILFGSTVAGRPPALPGVERMIGLFVNTLPVRVRVAQNATVLAWLKGLQDQQSEARHYEHSPLSHVQRWSEIRPGEPLFHSLLSFENYPGDDFTLAAEATGLTIDQARVIERTNYPLSVSVTLGAELAVKFIYNTQRFDDATIGRLAGHLQTLLEQIVVAPERRLADLSLLTAAEQNQMLVDWNRTHQDYPTELGVHTLFEEQAEQMPNAVAVVAAEQRLTYHELNRRANQLAHYLRKRGVGPETLVGIYVERGPELLIGLLGILKAGGAYLPLDAAYPRERLAFMLKDSQASALLTQQHLLEQLPQRQANVICLDADWDDIAQEETDNPGVEVLPQNLAYMIYTSGSTGQPKGVQIFHRALLNLVFWHQRSYTVTCEDRATQLASLGFDASVWELWPYLTCGASIYLPDAETRTSPQRLRDWLVANGITLTFLPTPLAEAVLAEGWPNDLPLRAMLTGGDQLRVYPDSSLRFELVNHYGPTENTVVASAAAVTQPSATSSLPTIGRPIANTEIYLLDRQLRPVPVGVPGELYIGGASLARGYCNQPALTAERFIPHPLSHDPGARLYKTGDLARFLPDGNIEFLGRIDQQVKINGFRIELGEIEAALRMHPAVNDTIVVARERNPQRRADQGTSPTEKYLVAYILPNPQQRAISSELRDFLRRMLPQYMVPAFYVHMEEWPLLSSGKIDRKALPAPKVAQPEPELEGVLPQTALEQTVAGIWREILHVEHIGRHDNFFDLGGHSLLLMQVSGKLHEQGQHNISLVDLFAYPTISALAHFLNRQDRAQPAARDHEPETLKVGRHRLKQQLNRRSSVQ